MSTALILAAGRGRRFAESAAHLGPKLLAPIDGLPMVRRTIAALRAGGVHSFTVVLAADADPRLREVVEREGAVIAVNPDPERGMLSSLQCALASPPAAGVCLVMPADMPFVRASTVHAVIDAARDGRSVSPRFEGRGGHPVALSHTLRTVIMVAPADTSLKPLLYADDPVLLDVDDPGILKDVDVAGDLA